MHLELCALVIESYDEAIEFFVDALGFDLIEDSPSLTNDGRPKRWVVVRPPGGGTGLLLVKADGPAQSESVGRQVAGRVGFFLRTEDFDAQYGRMVSRGVEFVTESRTEAYGRVAVFRDMAGNRWDLLGPSPTPIAEADPDPGGRRSNEGTSDYGQAVERARVTSGSQYEVKIGFSRALRVGHRVCVSGTAPVWPDGSCPDDAEVQARRCLDIIAVALRQLGADLTDVVRTRMYLVDPADAEAVGRAHAAAFDGTRPAATMVVVAALLDSRWRVEIEAEAELSEAGGLGRAG